MAESDFEARMRARRERVERAKAGATDAVDGDGAAKEAEPITDYWKMPKSGPRTTVLNSAWTWTLIVYVVIMAFALLSIAQNGLTILDDQSNAARIAIAVGLLYPAWRIAILISRTMKKRGIASDVSVLGMLNPSSRKSKTPARPGSVEARLEERRARLEKARKDGKI